MKMHRAAFCPRRDRRSSEPVAAGVALPTNLENLAAPIEQFLNTEHRGPSGNVLMRWPLPEWLSSPPVFELALHIRSRVLYPVKHVD